MSEWDDGYVAAALHDIGKLLLNGRRRTRDGKPDHNYGTWRPKHYDLACLGERLDEGQVAAVAARLGGSPALHLENDQQAALIRFHHNYRSRPESIVGPDLAMAAVALKFADGAHKSLYFWEDGSWYIPGVNWRCPWYYPFWGEVRKWDPEAARQRFLDAAGRVRERLDGDGKLDARLLVRIGQDCFSDYGDSTCLPVTSLHFHTQLTSALYLMVLKQLRERGGIPVRCTPTAKVLSLRLGLTQTVITLPPERLRYRLRDAMHLRKISQRLLMRLHQYLQEEYLSHPDLRARGFEHPKLSPFIFYGKEAIVLLNRQEDDCAICRIAEEVARETDTPFRIDRQPWLLVSRGVGEATSTLSFDQFGRVVIRLGEVEPRTPKDRRADTVWAMPEPEQVGQAAHECAACHRPIADGENVTDLEDELCCTCYLIRRKYRGCLNPDCAILFPAAKPSRDWELCPLCTHRAEEPKGPGRFLQHLDEFEGERVAIIALRIGATPGAMRVESELRLAQFREERLRAEEGVLTSCGLSGSKLQNELDAAKARMPLVHGTEGVLEYLQAVLEIEGHHEEWLRWSSGDEPFAQVVYLSPAFVVLLTSESRLSRLYRRLESDLQHLHLAHRLDIVTCDTHYPIYDALAPVFSGPNRQLVPVARCKKVSDAALGHRKRIRTAYGVWRKSMKSPLSYSDGFGAGEAALAQAAKDNPGQGLCWRIVRGGHERRFTNDLARRLLLAEPSEQSAAQLHAVAGLAESLAAVAPEGGDGVVATLKMDMDGRRELTESGRAAVLEALAEVEAGHMALVELAQYLRELARATRSA